MYTRVASIKRPTTLSADRYVEQLELSAFWGKYKTVEDCQFLIRFNIYLPHRPAILLLSD